ncbi:hypothetical protein [Streptomyces sp. KR55]|uniref:hypothetical protein n=1 Tax=Streptomyces sp. KR55 TaxID=3457425 RepID=UPI003FD67024
MPTDTNRLGGTMRRTVAIISASAVAVAGGIAGTVIWLSQPTQAEIEEACYNAITKESTETNRPDECESLSDDDYGTLRMGWFLENEGLGNVDEDPGDLLDYSDDGEVNGSTG